MPAGGKVSCAGTEQNQKRVRTIGAKEDFMFAAAVGSAFESIVPT
jgi:hypothetical protein